MVFRRIGMGSNFLGMLPSFASIEFYVSRVYKFDVKSFPRRFRASVPSPRSTIYCPRFGPQAIR